MRQPATRAGYTIAHAGRQVRFGPVAFWIAVGTVVIMAGWSVTAATYLAFRDDVLRTLIAHQADQQFAYEDRIAELRAQIDRTTSRQLLDQEQFEQKLDDLMRRQATLESRATTLSSITDPTTTGSIKPSAPRDAQRQAIEPRCDARPFEDFPRSRRAAAIDDAERAGGSLRRTRRGKSAAFSTSSGSSSTPRRQRPAARSCL